MAVMLLKAGRKTGSNDELRNVDLGFEVRRAAEFPELR